MASILEVPQQIALALSLASSATGVDYDYLAKTAARESNFAVDARARTSSARGLFQFIDETWLHSIKQEGPRFGLGDLARHITRNKRGRYVVRDRKMRQRILALRDDPKISSVMAGAYTRRNADVLENGVGRSPTPGELYLAHFLGARDAVRLINLARRSPEARADRHFQAAAKANRRIFFDGSRPRTTREVFQKLVRHYDGRARKSPRSSRSWSTTLVRSDNKALFQKDVFKGSSSVQALLREAAKLPADGGWTSHVRVVGGQNPTLKSRTRRVGQKVASARTAASASGARKPRQGGAAVSNVVRTVASAAGQAAGMFGLRGAMAAGGTGGVTLGLRRMADANH